MIFPSLLFLLLVVSYFSYWSGRGMNGFYISKPMMISHRGDTKHFPENTLEAFTAAEKLGFEGIELDVIASRTVFCIARIITNLNKKLVPLVISMTKNLTC